MARMIIKDLIRGDGYKKEIELYQVKVIKLEEKDIQRERVISFLNDKNLNYEKIIFNKDEQIGVLNNYNDDLQKQLKKKNSQLFLYKSLSVLGAITTFFLILK